MASSLVHDEIQEDIQIQTEEERQLLKIQKMTEQFLSQDLLENLQLLLSVKGHSILLRIVMELILSLVESKPDVIKHFANTFTVDILLKIFEDYQDQDL